MPLDLKGFYPDITPNEGLNTMAKTLQENKRYKEEKTYRRQKDQEQQDWRKLGLIQDLTDLSKHQTSSDIANTVGNQKAAEILQKYTAAASKMSGAELQAKISQDMSGVIGGMEGLKTELDASDDALKTLKSQIPSLDVSKLAQEHRADILHRRMDNNMEFINPMTVQPSEMDLTNADFLSKYIVGNKTLSEAIINPKGVEDKSILMGTPDSHTTFSAKQPFWKKPDFNEANVQGGYIPMGKDPQLVIKGSELPADALPSSNGKPFKLIDKDVYDRFDQDLNLSLELTAATRKQFPTYDTFNQTEKEYAKRNVLYNQIEALDQTNFHPTAGTKPPRVSVNVPRESKETPAWDLTEYPSTPDGGKNLTVPFQGYVVTAIGKEKLLAKNVIYYPSSKTFKVTEYTGRDENGEPTGETTHTISAKTMRQNIQGMNPGTDMKPFDALINKSVGGETKNEIPKPTGKTYLYNGKSIPYDKIEKAANQSGLSVEAYIKQFGIKQQ